MLLTVCFFICLFNYTKNDFEPKKIVYLEEPIDRQSEPLIIELELKQPEEEEIVETSNQVVRKDTASRGGYITMEATAYCMGTHTCTGDRVREGIIATDPNVIPLGSLVEIEGLGMYQALDTGGAIQGNIIDIYMSDYDACVQWGRRKVRVQIIRSGY